MHSKPSLHEICESDPQECLDALSEAFKTAEKGSHHWYSLELLRIDAYFSRLEFTKLSQVLDRLESDPNLPPKLELKLYISRAKLANYQGHKTDVELYQQKATEFLNSLKDNAKSPDLIIDYANFQITTKQYQLGIDALLPLEESFREHKNSLLKWDIYTNLGNLYSFIGNFEKSREYFQFAYDNAVLSQHEHNQTVGLYNVARGWQKLGDLDEAKRLFIQVLIRTRQQEDGVHFSITNYRVGEISFLQQSYEEASFYLNRVDASLLSKKQQAHLKELKSKAKM